MKLPAADTKFFFVSDLHGRIPRYDTLLACIRLERPAAVFLGGDLLPSQMAQLAEGEYSPDEFVTRYLVPEFSGIRRDLGPEYPSIFLELPPKNWSSLYIRKLRPGYDPQI